MKKYVEINGEKMEVKKAKKPFYKRIWVWGLGIIIIIAVANSGGEESAAPVEKAKTTEEVATTETAPKEEVNDAGISKEEFDQIQNGMTYDEVKAIIGSDGEVMSEVGSKGEQFHTIMYTWDGTTGFGANANFTFQEDQLNAKAQFGLE